MRSVVEIGTSVPAFLGKLWKLVNDPDNNHLISWSSSGKTFIITNQAEFARELLPLYYKHNNMASFIRQLNMYDFHKISSIDNGGLRFEKDEIEFSHPCFMKGQAFLLEHIKRKPPNHKSVVSSDGEKVIIKPELMTKVLSDVKQMKGKQENLDAKFSAIKLENEALWREVAILRQKHIKQQQIVNNLIQFLMSLVQPSRSNNSNANGVGVKRPYQLMINNEAHNSQEKSRRMKTLKLDKAVDLLEDNAEEGTTIHELAHDDIAHSTDSNAPSPTQYVTVELSPYNLSNASPSPGGAITPMQFQDSEAFDVELPVDQLPDITSPITDGTPNLQEVTDLYLPTESDNIETSPVPSTSSKNRSATVPPASKKSSNYNMLSAAPDLKLPADIFASDDSVDTGINDINLQSMLEDNLPEPVVCRKQDKMVGGIKLDKPSRSKHSKKRKTKDNLIPLVDIKTEIDENDLNNMTLATLNDNSKYQTMLRRDIFNKNPTDYPSHIGVHKNDLDDQIGTMQTDLDSIRELLLQNETIALDTNALYGLFGNNDPLSSYYSSFPLNNVIDDRTKPSNTAVTRRDEQADDSEIDGTNQLMSYTGNVPDFGDISLPDLEGENSQDACLSPGVNLESTLNTPQVVLHSPFRLQNREPL